MKDLKFNMENCLMIKDYQKQQKREINKIILISSEFCNKNIKKRNLKDYEKLIYDQFNNIKIKYNDWFLYYSNKLIKKIIMNFILVNNKTIENSMEEYLIIIFNYIELNTNNEEKMKIIEKIFSQKILCPYIINLVLKKYYKKILKQIYIFISTKRNKI